MTTIQKLFTNGLSYLFVAIVLLSVSSESIAQSPGVGADMWTGQMQQRTLFRPHAITTKCNTTTEAYVMIPFDTANPTDTSGVGFCIEKDERSADTWENARNTCASLNKRLPEPAEFKLACTFATALGLNNMTNSFEWESNFTFPIQFISGSTAAMGAADGGNGNCAMMSYGFVGSSGSSADSIAFRCVR
jgi:hypothetical protein